MLGAQMIPERESGGSMYLKEYVKGAGEGGFISPTPLTVIRREWFRREYTGAVRPGVGTRGKLESVKSRRILVRRGK